MVMAGAMGVDTGGGRRAGGAPEDSGSWRRLSRPGATRAAGTVAGRGATASQVAASTVTRRTTPPRTAAAGTQAAAGHGAARSPSATGPSWLAAAGAPARWCAGRARTRRDADRWSGRRQGSWYVNHTALEVPAWVATVTATRPLPGGTVAVHVVCDAHAVGAASSPKRARTWPSGLKRLAPVMTTCWPAPPWAGVTAAIEGTAPPPPVGAVPAAGPGRGGAGVGGVL